MPIRNLADRSTGRSAAVTPVETAFALAVGGLVHGIEPLDIINHDSGPLCELPNQFE
jgi:hypothetical protein